MTQIKTVVENFIEYRMLQKWSEVVSDVYLALNFQKLLLCRNGIKSPSSHSFGCLDVEVEKKNQECIYQKSSVKFKDQVMNAFGQVFTPSENLGQNSHTWGPCKLFKNVKLEHLDVTIQLYLMARRCQM